MDNNKTNQDNVNLDNIEDPELRAVLKRAYNRIDELSEKDETEASKIKPLLDFFLANVINSALRDQRDAMAIPFFSLSKRKRTEPIRYEKNGVKVTVAGLTTTGIATIYDADFLIWAASQLNEALRNGGTLTRRLWVVPYHFLAQTRRVKPGQI